MPKEDWGVKRLCPTTGKRFYDLNKSPIVSPYTGEIVDIESTRRKMTAAPVRAKPKKDDEDEVLVDDLDTDEDLLPVEEESEDVDIDDDLLEDDEDDTVSLDDLTDVAGDDDDT